MSIVQAKYIFHYSMLMFIVFYSLSGCLFFSFSKRRGKILILLQSRETKNSKGTTIIGPLLCFVLFFFTSNPCLFLLLLAVQSFQTHYCSFDKEIFSSHKALLSVHQRDTIIPISLVWKLRHEHHLYGIRTAGKYSQNKNAICMH